jgi:hypothetical protein
MVPELSRLIFYSYDRPMTRMVDTQGKIFQVPLLVGGENSLSAAGSQSAISRLFMALL